MKYISILLALSCSLCMGAELKKPQLTKPSVAKGPPAERPFPLHWGKPPALQTRDLVPLPGGFGRGSSTLAKWIGANLQRDQKRPPRPPEAQPRPEPSPEIKSKIEALRTKKKEAQAENQKLRDSLKGKTKEEALQLIKSFRTANKERYQEIKEAQKELLQSLREQRQTGARRE